jgi:large subunit ribosomal protein L4
MELAVKNIKGEDTGRKVLLDDNIFGIEPNDHVIYLDAKRYMANKRQGTHDSRERSDVSGSTRKIKRQKGTGTARAGDIKNPLFRGGGRVFGPHPRDYEIKLNKKVKALARKSALTYKAKDGQILVVEDFKMDNHKTKSFVEILNNLGVENSKNLVLIPETDPNLYLAARNLKNVKVRRAETINTYEILEAKTLILMEKSVKVIEELFTNK